MRRGRGYWGGGVEYKAGKDDILSIVVHKKVAQEINKLENMKPGNEVTGNEALCVDGMRLFGDVRLTWEVLQGYVNVIGLFDISFSSSLSISL